MDIVRFLLRFRRTVWCNFVLFLCVILYSVITTYTTYILIVSSTESSHKQPSLPGQVKVDEKAKTTLAAVASHVQSNRDIKEVEIWGKAAIGLYLWQHVFDMELEMRSGRTWQYGSIVVNGILFHFRTGPGVMPGKVPKDAKNVVLVINGRETEKIDFARMWLDQVTKLPKLRNLGVILLGNEQCMNDWLMPYMEKNGGKVKFAHVVYDIPYANDGIFYQWPLGVATYRGFPKFVPSFLKIEDERRYTCNFLGTVYKGSSRETLLNILKKYNLEKECYIKTRDDWLPNETDKSLQEYIDAVKNSDLTLNPVGKNTECYRIYEACALGSVPVVEDIMTPGNCDREKGSPLRLLKFWRAPFIYLKDWNELPQILEKERTMSLQEKVKRRQELLRWYKEFKLKMQRQLLESINMRFS